MTNSTHNYAYYEQKKSLFTHSHTLQLLYVCVNRNTLISLSCL